MSDLSFTEKRQLESLLDMGGGYVLDFTDRTFQEFVVDAVSRDIDDPRYGNLSKAKRLRTFWAKEPNHIVGKLIAELVKYAELLDRDWDLIEDCRRIANRLLLSAPVPEIDAISPNADGRDFEALAKSVRQAIEINEPESGLDRLHTYVVKYVRVLCETHGIDTPRDKPLHSLFGEYVKSLNREGLLESEMSERILRSSVSTLEAFNKVRNEKSFAHDNALLNFEESLLIFNHVCASIRFIRSLEAKEHEVQCKEQVRESDEIPF